MTVLLSDAITATRSLIDEPVAQFWSDAELTQWLNEACADSQRRAEWKISEVTIPVTASTQTYPAPDDTYRINKITFIPTPIGQLSTNNNTYTLEYRGRMEMDQVWGIQQQWPANYPLYYTLQGQPGVGTLQIITYPVPSQAGNLVVIYYSQTIVQTTTTLPIDAPLGFEDMMYDYAAYRAFRKDANPAWKDFKADYEAKLVSLTDSSRTYQDQANFVSTGQQALPQWLTSSEGW